MQDGKPLTSQKIYALFRKLDVEKAVYTRSKQIKGLGSWSRGFYVQKFPFAIQYTSGPYRSDSTAEEKMAEIREVLEAEGIVFKKNQTFSGTLMIAGYKKEGQLYDDCGNACTPCEVCGDLVWIPDTVHSRCVRK